MSWANAYVGTPYADQGRDLSGCDCWGLARLVYLRELSIALPSYADSYSSSEEAAEISALIDDQRSTPWAQVADIQCFDLLLFRRGGHSTHVGIALDHRLMLHMSAGDQAKIESQLSPRWVNRFVGSFRHADRLNRVAL